MADWQSLIENHQYLQLISVDEGIRQIKSNPIPVTLNHYKKVWEGTNPLTKYIFIPDLHLSGYYEDIHEYLASLVPGDPSLKEYVDNLSTYPQYTIDNYQSSTKAKFSSLIWNEEKDSLEWSPEIEEPISQHFQKELTQLEAYKKYRKIEEESAPKDRDNPTTKLIEAFTDEKKAKAVGLLPFAVGREQHLINGLYPLIAIQSPQIAAVWDSLSGNEVIPVLPSDSFEGLDLPLNFKIAWTMLHGITSYNIDSIRGMLSNEELSLRDFYMIVYYLYWFQVDTKGSLWTQATDELIAEMKSKKYSDADKLTVAIASKSLLNSKQQETMYEWLPGSLRLLYFFDLDDQKLVAINPRIIKSFRSDDWKVLGDAGLMVFFDDPVLAKYYVDNKIKPEDRKFTDRGGFLVTSIQPTIAKMNVSWMSIGLPGRDPIIKDVEVLRIGTSQPDILLPVKPLPFPIINRTGLPSSGNDLKLLFVANNTPALQELVETRNAELIAENRAFAANRRPRLPLPG